MMKFIRIVIRIGQQFVSADQVSNLFQKGDGIIDVIHHGYHFVIQVVPQFTQTKVYSIEFIRQILGLENNHLTVCL